MSDLICKFLVEEDEEEQEVAAPTPATASGSTQATSSARNRRQPLAAQQLKPRRPVDRRQALEEFKKTQLLKKAELAKSKKPPFKVGTYKLETSIRPGTVPKHRFSYNYLF